jgi:hypothetical protein
VYYSGFSSETEPVRYNYKKIYYNQLAHAIVDTEVQDLLFAC